MLDAPQEHLGGNIFFLLLLCLVSLFYIYDPLVEINEKMGLVFILKIE